MKPNDSSDPLERAKELGESYAALVGQADWSLDHPEMLEEPVSAPIPEAILAEESPTTVAIEPPVAQAANDTNVPPAPLQIVEALLFVGGIPLKHEHVREALRGISSEQFHDCIEALNHLYNIQNRPYHITHVPQGFVLRVKPRYTNIREKLYGGPREARLNQTALDVLALIAYRQPIGKAEIDSIRGCESGTTIRQLVRLGLVSSHRQKDVEYPETLFQTTDRFLEIFRLRDASELPKIGDAKKI